MKKHLSMLCVIGCFSQSVWAADINNLSALTQPAFKDFSDDLGAALSYKPITPTAPLGVTGFDIGVEATSTKIRNLDLATNSSSTRLVVPKLHVYKGFLLASISVHSIPQYPPPMSNYMAVNCAMPYLKAARPSLPSVSAAQ